MEKISVYNPKCDELKESFNKILREISAIRPHTTFTKEQEEEFLKDAIVIFEYLKLGIDIKSTEIFINNGEIPFSCLEKMHINFSERLMKNDSKTYKFQVYLSDEGKAVKIYEFQNDNNSNLGRNSKILLEGEAISKTRKIYLVKADSFQKSDSTTKFQLKNIIDYALKNDVILLFDATSSKEAKEAETLKSIYEIENAKEVAIEFKRFSSEDNDKINCGYMVVPESLKLSTKCIMDYNLCKIKDILQDEMQKGNVSRRSLKNSFLIYAGQ